MKRKVLSAFFFILLFLIIPPAFYFLNSQPVNLNQEKIEYNLPYPGILPDHPLFFIKNFRDKILEISKRDYFNKAELYLLFSDKRVAMALAMAKGGKDKYAVNAFEQSEKYFARIPPLIDTAKKQGTSATSDFILRLKLSNSKHKEIGETLLKDLPQGQNEKINEALKLNQEIKKKIEKL